MMSPCNPDNAHRARTATLLMPEISSFANVLINHILDDRYCTGRGLHKIKVLNPSQINGQDSGFTVFEPIEENDSQNE